ncbi:MAG: hypothetical protein WD696_20940, partial [Bryobacteraceae bacterium]
MAERKRTTQTKPNPAPILEAVNETVNVCPCCDRGPDPIPILRELSKAELGHMEEFLQVVLHFGGDSTPAEKFILDLVRYHATYPIT